MTTSAETGNQHLIVLIDEVQATIPGPVLLLLQPKCWIEELGVEETRTNILNNNPPDLPRHQQEPLTESLCPNHFVTSDWHENPETGQKKHRWTIADRHHLVPNNTIETCHSLILTNLGTNAAIFLPFLIS